MKGLNKNSCDVYPFVTDDGILVASELEYISINLLGLKSEAENEVVGYIGSSLYWISKKEQFRVKKDFLYFADALDLIEYGTSINSCWLTEKGENALECINEFMKNEYIKQKTND